MRLRAFARLSFADSACAAERTLRPRSSGGNSERVNLALKSLVNGSPAALDWSSRDIGRDHRVLAAICARSLLLGGHPVPSA